MRQLNQSLHFVVFLFLWVLAAEAVPAAPVRGDIPVPDDAFILLAFFFEDLGTRAGEEPVRCPAAELLLPV